ncbi:HAD-IA family hydrolase [Thalassotalea ponticola]|uniref:HAD family hydrolase n=1 Tax=Thalassotalea ponticola TaxID=1523392 RepID=UPI0025B3702B|nr:HAD-IA family hydrolase [Thalassotalea ponticola]MDN3652588.1 HAD-IA family hydrolase [Thalassotalea ponticola]
MHHYQLYIFDWDGTLMNSINKIVASLQHAAECAELPIPSQSDCKKIIGAGMSQAAMTLFPKATVDQLMELEQAYRRHFVFENRVASPLYPGCLDLINNLQRSNKQLAIATSKGRIGLDNCLRSYNLDGVFDCLRTADDAKPKPHPDMLEQILSAMNMNRKDALYIGDSRYDIEMANNASIDSIAITHGAGEVEDLIQSRPTKLVNSIDELARQILISNNQ